MSKMNNKNPFKVPSGYFDRLEEDLHDKIKNKAQRNNSFRVPDNYFSTLEKEVNHKINGLTTSKKKSIGYYSIAIAASILVLFSLNIYNDTSNSDDVLIEYAEEFYTYETDPYETASLMEFETIVLISDGILEQLENTDNLDDYPNPYDNENFNTYNYENYND